MKKKIANQQRKVLAKPGFADHSIIKKNKMGTVYIITAEADTAFLEQQVLPVLPCNGYSHWLASFHLSKEAGEDTIAGAMNQCQAIITVVSKNLFQSSVFRKEIDLALSSKTNNIVVQTEALDDRSIIPGQLWALPCIDLIPEKQTDIKETLVALLPAQTQYTETNIPDNAKRIGWNEGIFSKALALATARHDHVRAQWLISILSQHVAYSSDSYSEERAIADLQALRQEREFRLMLSYGNAVIRSGTNKDKVRRLFAQALIETGQYDAAMEVLNSILKDPGSSTIENFEARGLIGRIYKQRYVNDPGAEGSASLIKSAVTAYITAYLKDENNFWHGVNAASCIRRMQRDGIDDSYFKAPHYIAEKIIQDLNKLSETGPLQVWDCASKVEAFVALERYEEAEQALEVYIHHPAMTAFEISSTYRQFDQVLQLSGIPEGVEILNRLRNTMERYRAGTVLTSPASTPESGQATKDDESKLKALIIRLSDPSWNPGDIPGFEIQSRLGKIVTARGSNKNVRLLLEDPMVISIEASRPAGIPECNRSLPYIKVSSQYNSSAGNYEETGGMALIAIIDNSIDVLHKAFLDANGDSRIEGVWDQTDNSGTAPLGFDYGTFHSKAAITGYVQTQSAPPNLWRIGQRHGTHVASIAAGRGVGSFAGGVAPDAKLLVVIPNNNGSIGYSKSFIDALAFIDKFATGIDLPVVVNVSQGMNAGAHDGSSSLEAAFDAFSGSGRKAGRVVVKSAGNERNKAGHARVTLQTGGAEDLTWIRLEGADAVDRIELWWSSADEVRFRLRQPLDPKKPGPQPEYTDWVGTKNTKCSGTFLNGGPYLLTYTKRHVDNGDSLLVIELGKDVDTFVPAGTGEWLVEIEGIQITGNGEIHGWIERSRGGATTSFQLPHVSEDMTLSIPGTAETVITVGAIDASKPIRVDKSSSYGPTRSNGEKPQVCAPGVNVLAADAGTSDNVFSDSGTSMAAPHVAGAIALLLSRASRSGKTLNANQIAKALCQKTQNCNGTWERGQGYGVIDVSALLNAFE